MINLQKLTKELQASGIQFSGVNINGIVWDVDGTTEIQDRPDVAAIIAVHDPTEQPITEIGFDLPIKAPDFIVANPKPKNNPKEALTEALTEAHKQGHKSIALIVLDVMNYIEDLEKRITEIETK